jgi:hypothetical protein
VARSTNHEILHNKLSTTNCPQKTLYNKLSTTNSKQQTLHNKLTTTNSPQQTHHNKLTTTNSPQQTLHNKLTTTNSPQQTLNNKLSTTNSPQQTIHNKLSTTTFSPLYCYLFQVGPTNLPQHSLVKHPLSTILNYNQQDATFLDLFIATDALHVSGGSSAHHQAHISVHTASGIVKQYCCWLLSLMRWNCVPSHPR